MFLTQQEIIELTGRRQSAAQVRALKFMGIENRLRPDGTVAVLLEHVKAVMGFAQETPKETKEWTPRWNRHA